MEAPFTVPLTNQPNTQKYTIMIESKKLEAVQKLLISTSVPFICCECRGVIAEQIKYIDKKTGKAAVFSKLVYLCEANGEGVGQFKVTSDIPVGLVVLGERGQEKLYKEGTQDLAPWPAKKGDQVLVLVDGVEKSSGNITMRASKIDVIQP